VIGKFFIPLIALICGIVLSSISPVSAGHLVMAGFCFGLYLVALNATYKQS
jgi:hypothetical protein